jgi:hypothetical protein
VLQAVETAYTRKGVFFLQAKTSILHYLLLSAGACGDIAGKKMMQKRRCRNHCHFF